ncbi:MAG: kelch repeat-containing protein [Sneathiella sp.]
MNKLRWMLTAAFLAMAAITGLRAFAQITPNHEDFKSIPPNKWIKYHQPLSLDWRRQQHSGIAYDSKRGNFYLFGSDTHGKNWDNRVHEFNPTTKSWHSHYPIAPLETYRADDRGRAIAGGGKLIPWAMHTFDNILYDPELDAIVVSALPEHNRAAKKRVPTATSHPTWVYKIATHTWEILENKQSPSPKFFAAASAFDSNRNTLVAYRWGLWELGPERAVWQKALAQSHHKIHFNMEYDSVNKKLAVFGDHRNSNSVWVYTPGATAGSPGSWEENFPAGDVCPRDQHFPVAFDQKNAVFLLVPDNNRAITNKNGKTVLKANSSSTFVYDLAKNMYLKLPNADLPTLGMNYMMVYDKFGEVFFLVTGNHKSPPTVWVLRLDLDNIPQV